MNSTDNLCRERMLTLLTTFQAKSTWDVRDFIAIRPDVRIYNYGLSATQVKKMMNEGSAVRFGALTGSP